MDGWGAALLAIPGQLIARGACNYCKEWFGYVLNYEKNVKEVQQLRSQLEMKRNDIEAQAEEEIRRENRLMAEEVSALLDEASKLLETEVDWEDMLKDSKERKKAEQCCPAGFCSWNPKYRHHLSRIAKEKAAQIDEIKKRMTERASTQLTIARTLPPFETDPANFCPDLKSRVEMLNLIIQKVRDDGVKIIAIHGMGGAGKTTLVEEVAKIADKEKWFSKVVMVEMSIDPDIKKIQDQIAEQIDFKGLDGITFERERAKRLREALVPKDNDTKNLLVVLDNIWPSHPTLHELGIPDGCKIVLTSREETVCLGIGVEAHNIIHVQDLDDQEARDLLMKRVGHSIIDKEIYEPTLRELLENCPHLPLSIRVLGDVLRSNKDLVFWKNVVLQLKNPVPKHAAFLDKIYPVLKLSYNYIGDGDKKYFLLLCGLFEPGMDISITDLFRYGIGLSLFELEESLDFALEKVYIWANELKGSSLLTEVDFKKHTVKIHDDVRAAVIIFANEEGRPFHVGHVRRYLKEDAYEKHTAISVWSYDNINSLIGRKLDKLLLFSLVDRPPRPKFGDNFFLSMKNIKVLKLRGIEEMETLPSSIEHLENLRTLLLEECPALVDILYICKLVKLRVLSLRGSRRIPKLPDDFGALAELKCLDMKNCPDLKDITAGIMMKLEQLESLYMSRSFSGWENGGSMASLSELQCMPHLRALEIDIGNLKELPDGIDFPAKNLSKFHISINSTRGGWELSESGLHLKLGNASADDVIKKGGLKSLLRCAESLQLKDVRDLENIIPYLCENDELVNLTSIQIFECQAFKYLINPRGLSRGRSSHFHNLRELSLYRLEALQPYALPIENASRLRVLKVCDCEALEYIFWTPTNLETPEIQEGTRSSKEIEFTTLKELKLKNLSRCRVFCSEINNANETCRSLFTEKMKFPALEKLEIKGLSNITEVWDGRGKELSGAFPELHSVTLKSCHNARHMWTERLHSESEYFSFDLKKLQNLQIDRCNSMKQVILIEVETAKIQEETKSFKEVEFKSLKELKLFNLGRLQGFCSERNSSNGICRSLFTEKMKFPALEILEMEGLGTIMEVWDGRGKELSRAFPKLRMVTLKNCHKARYMWIEKLHSESGQFSFGLKELQYLRIKRCDDMEQVILIEDETANIQEATKSFKEVEFTSLKELKLFNLGRLLGFCIERNSTNGTCRSLFTEKMKFPALETLEIDGLAEIMKVWDGKGKELSGAFPKLSMVTLENCHNARHMWIEKLHSESEYFSFGLKKLRNLEIVRCDSMEQVILIEDETDSGVNLRDKISFPNLSRLHLFDLKSLRSFYRGKPSMEFPSLEWLSLWETVKMVTFTEEPTINKVKKTNEVFFNQKAIFPSLKTLVLLNNSVLTEMWDLSFEEFSIGFPIMEKVDLIRMSRLKHVWTNKRLCEETLVFGNLKELWILDCKSFKSLFPPVAPSLVSMKTASFPALHTLKLVGLLSFQCLIQVRQSLELSNLKELHLRILPKLKRIVGMKSAGETMGQELRQDDVIPTLFDRKVSIRSLEELHLSSLINVVGIWDIGTGVPKNLRKLEIEEMPKLKCACKNTTGTEFQCLEDLTVGGFPAVKILFKLRIEKNEAEEGEHYGINTNPSKKDVDLSTERGLFIRPSVGFPNLQSLKIRHMPELESMSDCEDKDDGPPNCSIVLESTTQNSTWLPSLKKLELVGLPKLKYLSLSISSKLEQLEIRNSFLGKESLVTPKFIMRGRSLQLLHDLTISDCKDMKVIIAKENSEEDEQQIEIVFPNLHTLRIHDMPQLERISDCEDEDDGPPNCSIFSESTTQNSTWFPYLNKLVLVGLPKLKHLSLSISSKLELLRIEDSFLGKESLITPRSILRGRSLRLLRYLTIYDCKDMKVIIAKENSEEDEQQIEIVFPHLESISLASMPLLHAFNAASYRIEAPVLKIVTIDCERVEGNPHLNLNLLLEQHNDHLRATTISQPGAQ